MPTSHRRNFLRFGAAAAAWAALSPGRANAAPTGLAEVNVKDYQARGDGITDDTAAIHAARDAAGVGGRVVLPTGTYLVSGYAGVRADIAGQTWDLSDGAVIMMATQNSNASIARIYADDVTIIGGVFDGSNATDTEGTQGGIVVTASGATFRNVTVQNSPFHGILMVDSDRFTATGCTFTNCLRAGIWVQNNLTGPSNLYDVTITDNLVDATSAGDNASGIGLYGQHTQRINRVTISRNTLRLPVDQTNLNSGCIGALGCNDLVVDSNICFGGYISISISSPVRATISNNLVKNFDYVGIELPVLNKIGTGGEVDTVTVIGNTIDADGTEANSGVQGSAGNIRNVSIVGNIIKNFSGSTGSMIHFESDAPLDRITVVGNVLTSSKNPFVGMFLGGTTTNLSVSGNVIDGTDSPVSTGVEMYGAVSGVSFTGNQFSNLTTGAVRLLANTAVTQDYINVTGNNYVDCHATLLDSTSGSAVVGSHNSTEPLPGASDQITSFELGHSTDTTVSRSAPGVAAVEGNPISVRVSVPSTATDAGKPGYWAADSSYIYTYTGDGSRHSWVRATAAAW